MVVKSLNLNDLILCLKYVKLPYLVKDPRISKTPSL